MADLEHFSLRWNNFHSNLSSGFQTLLHEEDLVDVTLAAGGEFVQAHKIILSICSPYFKQLFKANPCKHPIVILKDVYHKDLVDILQFMYQGEVNVRQEDLGAFLKTAELLQVKGLTGQDSPAEHPAERLIAPIQTVSECTTSRPRQAKRRVYKPSPRLEKQMASAQSAMPPFKQMRSGTPTSGTSVVVSEEPSVEYHELKCPKQEPIDFEHENGSAPSAESHIKGDPLEQIIGGESSHSHHDSMQGMSTEPEIVQDIKASLQQPSISLTPDSGPAGSLSTLPGSSTDMAPDGEQGILRYVESRKGRLQLVHDGYIYGFLEQKGTKKYWRCVEYPRSGCRGFCKTVAEAAVAMTRPHNHMRQDDKIRQKTLVLQRRSQICMWPALRGEQEGQVAAGGGWLHLQPDKPTRETAVLALHRVFKEGLQGTLHRAGGADDVTSQATQP